MRSKPQHCRRLAHKPGNCAGGQSSLRSQIRCNQEVLRHGRLRRTHEVAEYYTEFAEKLPEDTVILTAGCANTDIIS